MYLSRAKIYLSAFFVMLAVAPILVHASTFTGPIDPSSTLCGCAGNEAPDYGCVLILIQNLMNFFIYFATLVITMYIAMAGFAYMTSGGNPEKHGEANKRILNAVIGLMIVLGAWLIVNSVMSVLYQKSSFGDWNSILSAKEASNCIKGKPTPPLPGLSSAANAGGGPGDSTAPGPTTGNAKAIIAGQAAATHISSGVYGVGHCAIYVREDLAAGGYTDLTTNHPASASQYGPYLEHDGFVPVAAGSPQTGDVAVFQPVPGHDDGHIQIYDGTNWVSDFKQQNFLPNTKDYQGGSYTIYRAT
jgi:hypothetical protein